jgi:hypothetical protein
MLIHTPMGLAQHYRDQRKLRSLSQATVAQEVSLRQDRVCNFPCVIVYY